MTKQTDDNQRWHGEEDEMNAVELYEAHQKALGNGAHCEGVRGMGEVGGVGQ